jgi:hypothetical protein
MKPGDLVRVRPDLSDKCAGKIGVFVAEVDLETYFNPICVLVEGSRRYYGLDEIETAEEAFPK